MKRVLIVEDNPMNMVLISEVMADMEFDVDQAATGEEGLRIALESPPDLILLDLRLPGISGIEAVRRLKSNPATAAVPTIALTAQAMVGDREEALEAGFDAYHSKPIQIRKLRELISTMLGI